MAVASLTYNFDSLLSTTLMNYRPTLVDNILNACPVIYWLRSKGRTREEDGGERLVIPLSYGKNTTIKTLTSGYSPVDTTPQDNITSCYYTWCQIAGSITISHKELRQNSGKHKIINLLDAKTKDAEMSFIEILNKKAWAVSAATGEPQSIPDGVSIDGSGTIGGINSATYAWWANQYTASTSDSTWAKIMAGMASTYNKCSKGGDGGGRSFPDAIFCTRRAYEVYETACRDKVRLYDDKVADLGFGGLRFKGATMYWDEYTPISSSSAYTARTDPDAAEGDDAGTMFFLNSKHTEMVIDKGSNMKIEPFITPENQLAKVAIIHIMYNICFSNRRKQGAYYDINTTASS